MAGAMSMQWQYETLRSLWVMYQSYMLDTWDHTSQILCAWSGKKRAKPEWFHPYRHTSNKHTIKPSNIKDLAVLI